MEELKKKLSNCSKCSKMVESRRHYMGEHHCPISFHSSENASLMFVGLAPGTLKIDWSKLKMEDQFALTRGSGKILFRLFKDLVLPLDKIHITNLIKCHTPLDNVFYWRDVERCIDLFLRKEIELAKPNRIFVLGRKVQKYFDLYLPDVEYSFMYHPSAIARGFREYKDFKQQFIDGVCNGKQTF
jgi:uracil-DNA glycosylase family 4